jgi:hypothetical protein
VTEEGPHRYHGSRWWSGIPAFTAEGIVEREAGTVADSPVRTLDGWAGKPIRLPGGSRLLVCRAIPHPGAPRTFMDVQHYVLSALSFGALEAGEVAPRLSSASSRLAPRHGDTALY